MLSVLFAALALVPGAATPNPLFGIRDKTLHDRTIHATKTPNTFITNAQFFDTETPPVVRGVVTSLTGGGNQPITGFTVEVSVTNNSKFDWRNYVYEFGYAQHGAGQWPAEKLGNSLGNQPVLTPLAKDAKNQGVTIYTYYAQPGNERRAEVPGRLRGALKAGATDKFEQAFTIEGNGTPVGGKLFTYLTSAKNSGLDIHWARSGLFGPSIPAELSFNAIPGGTPGFLYRFDDPNPNNLPTNNDRQPFSSRTVALFPVLSEEVLRKIESLPRSPGPMATFDPVSGALTFSGGNITNVELVGDPANPVYSGDILHGARIVVEGLVHRFDVNGGYHSFDGGELRIVDPNGQTLMLADLLDFGSADLETSGRALTSFGFLDNLLFPQGSGVSPFFQDMLNDLAADPLLSLDFAVRALDGRTFAAHLNEALAAGAPVTFPVGLTVVLNGVPEPTTLVLLAAGVLAIGAVRGRRTRAVPGLRRSAHGR